MKTILLGLIAASSALTCAAPENPPADKLEQMNAHLKAIQTLAKDHSGTATGTVYSTWTQIFNDAETPVPSEDSRRRKYLTIKIESIESGPLKLDPDKSQVVVFEHNTKDSIIFSAFPSTPVDHSRLEDYDTKTKQPLTSTMFKIQAPAQMSFAHMDPTKKITLHYALCLKNGEQGLSNTSFEYRFWIEPEK